MDKIESKCVKLQATRQFIAEIVAGRMKPAIPIIHLQKELKNSYVYYNSDKDVFEIIYYTNDCAEGTIPESISAIEFKTIEVEDYIKKDKIRELINKLKTTKIQVGNGCFDESDYDILKVEELLKELDL